MLVMIVYVRLCSLWHSGDAVDLMTVVMMGLVILVFRLVYTRLVMLVTVGTKGGTRVVHILAYALGEHLRVGPWLYPLCSSNLSSWQAVILSHFLVAHSISNFPLLTFVFSFQFDFLFSAEPHWCYAIQVNATWCYNTMVLTEPPGLRATLCSIIQSWGIVSSLASRGNHIERTNKIYVFLNRQPLDTSGGRPFSPQRTS